MGRTDLYHRRRTSGPAWALAARRARRICAFEYGPQKTKKTKNKKLTVETTTSTACTTHYTTTLLHYGSTHTQYTRYVILRDRLPRDSPRSDPCSSSSSCSCSLPRPVPRHGPWSGLFFFVGALANSQQVWQTLHVYFFTLVSWSVKIKYIFYIPIPISIPRR